MWLDSIHIVWSSSPKVGGVFGHCCQRLTYTPLYGNVCAWWVVPYRRLASYMGIMQVGTCLHSLVCVFGTLLLWDIGV